MHNTMPRNPYATLQSAVTLMNWLLFITLISSFFLHQESNAVILIWSCFLLLLVIAQRKHHISGSPVSPAWIWVFAALILTTITSRSIGASLTAYIRYTLGFLVCIAASQLKPTYLSGVTVWAYRFFHTIILLFLLFFGIKAYMPELNIFPVYNGIIAVNGHHPIAYLIVLGFPLLLETYRRTGSKNSLMVIVYTVVSLLLSASRGAMFLIALWCIGLATVDRDWQKKRRGISAVVIIVFTVLLGIHWISGFSYEQKNSLIHQYPALSVFIKEHPRDDLRREFLYQAIQGIKHSPILGNGPGTFALVSRAFERRPSVYSAHPHSFVMQLLSDQGILGSIPIFILMGLIIVHSLKHIKHHKDARMRALSWGILLSLIYSVFEGNVNGIGVWMLWWAAAGFITTGKPRENRVASIMLIRVQYVTLIIFVLSAMLSTLFTHLGNTYVAAYTAPYRKDLVVRLLSEKVSPRDIPILHFFYQRDPDVLFALATLGIESRDNYTKATRLDPYNYRYWQQAVWRFSQEKNSDAQIHLLCDLIQLTQPSRACRVTQLQPLLPYLMSPEFAIPVSYLQGADGLSKFYYYLGLTLFQATQDAETAIYFWTLARDNAPNWGYYHLELASAHYYWKNDPTLAQRVLDDCLRQPLAKHGCFAMAQTPDQLYAPGIYASDIAAIPAIQ